MNHIWRQRFPDGTPEQITSGPTEEEGTAISPDGGSLVTAVTIANASLWVHDQDGDRQVAVEGNAADPRFTPDGKKLISRMSEKRQTSSYFIGRLTRTGPVSSWVPFGARYERRYLT
jgi:hypothetical protein